MQIVSNTVADGHVVKFITDDRKHLNFVDDGHNEYWLFRAVNIFVKLNLYKIV